MKNGQNQSELGGLIDSPMDALKNFVKDKNIGYIRSLIILLEETYMQLVGLNDKYLSNNYLSPEICNRAVREVYAEMLKIEEKITFLSEYEKTLRLSK